MGKMPLLRCIKSWLPTTTCQLSSQPSILTFISRCVWQQHWSSAVAMTASNEPLTPGACTRCTHTTSYKCRALVGEFREHWIETLTKRGVPVPELSVKYILEHVLCVHNHSITWDTHSGAIGTSQIALSDSELEMATQMLTQRLQRVPVQYIVGEWDFRNLTLKMRPPVLIPRPETEELVGLVLEHSCVNKPGESSIRRFLDVGCGSGAIAIALLQEGKVEMEGCAVDKSKEAVALTRENALRNGVHSRLSVVHCSAENCPSVFGRNQFDFIVANPPYIPSNEMRSLQPEVLWYEDHGALDGGDGGLHVTTAILEMSRHVLKRNGHVWLETGLRQLQGIHSLLMQHHQWELYHTCTYKDYTQRERFHQLVRM